MASNYNRTEWLNKFLKYSEDVCKKPGKQAFPFITDPIPRPEKEIECGKCGKQNELNRVKCETCSDTLCRPVDS